MTTGPVRASSEWLRLREPADAAARASELVEKVRSCLPTHGGATIHDLGCGTGSMANWLAVRLPGPQHWVMYYRDDELLTLAAADPPDRASDGTPVTMEARRRDITRMELVELAGAALITASALLDAMTAAELERLVAPVPGRTARCSSPSASQAVSRSRRPSRSTKASQTRSTPISDAPQAPESCSVPTRSAPRSTASPGWASKSWSARARGGSAPVTPLSRPRGSPAGWPRHASSDPSCGPTLRRTQGDA